MLRTHTCGELTAAHVGETVKLGGWVDTVRDHGGIIFIDLRDKYGITQVVFDPSDSQDAAAIAHSTRSEYVISIKGDVIARPESMINASIATGAIEIKSTDITILNRSETPPFPLEEAKAQKVSEDLRMQYRYLDLRRDSMQMHMKKRHKMSLFIRNYLDSLDFTEVETPILTKSTPEGARDYLVPNRITPGTFYALPQAPQQYKQILQVACTDRYFQMARCFRDEDLRADRQPEFTQVDIEMSWVEPEDIYGVIDGILASSMEACGHERPALPLPRMSWHDAMNTYGSDKPDLRFGMELTSLNEVFSNTEFKVFKGVIDSGNAIKGINAKGIAQKVPGRVIDEWTEIAKECGLGGMAYIKVNEAGDWKSPITKFFSESELEGLKAALNIEAGDLVLFAADELMKVNECLGKLRLLAADISGEANTGEFKFTWVTEFPLFETNTEGNLVPMHHPFTSVYPEDMDLLGTDPLAARAQAYDVVLNGVELGSGSIRIHDPEVQSQMFTLLRVSEEEKKELFGHLLKALSFGAPPHGGFAIGYDRLCCLLIGGETIRDVIAFPKNHKGIDLMMEAPGSVSKKQLRDVYIELDIPEVEEV